MSFEQFHNNDGSSCAQEPEPAGQWSKQKQENDWIRSAASTLGDKGDWRLNQIDRQQLIISHAAAPLIDAKTYPVVTKSDAALLKI
jgi:hypothetical protein